MSKSGAANSPKRIGLLAVVGSHDITRRPGWVCRAVENCRRGDGVVDAVEIRLDRCEEGVWCSWGSPYRPSAKVSCFFFCACDSRSSD